MPWRQRGTSGSNKKKAGTGSPGTATLIPHRSTLEDGRDEGQEQGRDRKDQTDSNKGKTLHTIEYFKSSNEAAPLKEVWTTEDAYAFIFHLHPDQAVVLRVRFTLSIAPPYDHHY